MLYKYSKKNGNQLFIAKIIKYLRKAIGVTSAFIE